MTALNKLSLPGHPINLDDTRVLEVGVGGGYLDIFFSRLSFLFSISLYGRRSNID